MLSFPTLSVEAFTSSSAGFGNQLPLSFEQPFDDPNMEPVPLGPPISSADLLSAPSPFDHVSSSTLVSPKSGSSFLSKPALATETDTGKSLYSLLFEQADGIVWNKRTSGDLIADMSTPLCSKRQRTGQRASEETGVMRFRPYQDHQWRVMYKKLVQYTLKNGHCCVPHSYQDDPMLARWVKRQRYQYKKFEDNDPTSTMTTHRIQQLDSIGFVWHSHASAWQTKLNELKAFENLTGHCNVPSNYTKNPSLSAWTRCQRRQYRLWRSGCSSTMTIQRCEQLESLGFSFENPNSGSKK